MAQTSTPRPTRAAWIPDRRRKHFPLNGGPKPTENDRDRARRGLDAARHALAEVGQAGPADSTRLVPSHSPEQTARARRGIAAARDALADSNRAA